MAKYALDQAWQSEKDRLDALASIYEDGTERHIQALDLSEGWRCAEIGGGTGTVARWLCERVGPSGHVVATDLDTRFLDQLDMPNLEVRRHNIVEEPLEPATYDLIHVRLVLMHLGENCGRALTHMVEALKPGGWLIAEEFDDANNGSMMHPPDEQVEKVTAAIPALFQQLGVDPYYGRKLPSELEAAGLTNIHAEVRTTLVASGSPQIRALTFLLEFLRDRFVDAQILSSEEVDHAIAAANVPGRRWHAPPLMVAAWGRRPAQ